MCDSNLVASTQYGDYKGTSSADTSDHYRLRQLAETRGIDMEKYFIIGTRLYIVENHLKPPVRHWAYLLLVDTSEVGDTIPDIQSYIASHDGKLPCFEVSLEVSLEEYLMHFKRLAVVLTNKSLKAATEFELQELDFDLEEDE